MPHRLARTPSLLLALLVCLAAPCAAQETDGADSRFDTLDVNRDGVLSVYEFSPDVVFAALDNDRDDRISASELQALLGHGEGALSADGRIGRADSDGDGQLSDAEIRRGLAFRFQWLDKDKDGNVNLAELRAGFGVPMLN